MFFGSPPIVDVNSDHPNVIFKFFTLLNIPAYKKTAGRTNARINLNKYITLIKRVFMFITTIIQLGRDMNIKKQTKVLIFDQSQKHTCKLLFGPKCSTSC